MPGPRLLTPELLQHLPDAVERLLYAELVADELLISPRTLRHWMQLGRKAEARLARDGPPARPGEEPYLAVLAAFKSGRAMVVGKGFAAVVAAADGGTWQAGAWICERLQPELFGTDRPLVLAMKRQIEALTKEIETLVAAHATA